MIWLLPDHNTINISILLIIFMKYVRTCFVILFPYMSQSLKMVLFEFIIDTYEVVEYVNSYEKE
jgi:hypothetical protein